MENKSGKWMYQTKSWNLPKVGTADFIEDKATQQVCVSKSYDDF